MLTTSPAAHSDDFGLSDSIADLLGGGGAATAAVGNTLGDTSAAATQTDLDLNGQGVGHVLAAIGSTDTPAELFAAHGAAAVSGAGFFQQFVYDPIHTGIQGWIHSPFGAQVDSLVNQTAGRFLIGDGANGTASHPDGGAGGLLFGDGGNGWDATGTDDAGGAGGNAPGLFGNGGDGGDGGHAAPGGDGGDGGRLFGIGGNGGNGGDGGDGLPALGGAGGNAGMLGSHGDVGHYGTPASGPPNGATDGIGTTGSWITNSAGQVVIGHGFNYSELETSGDGSHSSGVISDANAAFLAANGFNSVRLAISWAALEPEMGVFNTAYLASVEKTVQILGEHGIHTIIDMHQDAYSPVFGYDGAPAWAVQDGGLPNPKLPFPYAIFFNPAETYAWDAFWSNAKAPDGVGLENHYAQLWEYVANAFHGNPDVLGFEIMNEPYSGSQTIPSLLGSHFFEAQQLTPFYNQVTSAIRAVDPTAPVFFEPSMLPSTAGLPTHLGTVDFPGTVYSFHDYCEFELKGGICLPDVAGLVDNAADYAQAHGIPAFMTEFGNGSGIAQTMQPADQKLFGWTEWAFSGQGAASLVYNPDEPPTGANVNTAELVTLAQPYPQVVSGTPNPWSFDNGTFHFSYSTAMADGQGSFPAGSQTTISVPKIEFPNGYQVSVTGGQVISAPNAPVLVIASDGSASTVSVTVNTT